ncbi:LacI family DNA-binding transcriptional regulator [Flexilinea flocculi]|jgi:LacI family transcriptional regulator|uniref:ABC-type sugar transport system, periplasmic component, contains N-terminal xre family HTH domain n=1 Tax=Flexilinea flocculi TaxID=1678840 RepID=A0A0S7BXT5_9CHLR|nr:LacI family DNA-binding transcriptional regulator [Flexilinea flocculi]NMB92897.1 substrate-binding domain-containing protein [Flexilinea flocculi]GAP41464.1 ABC-type sugar transport system, periplasmic component, contains N-terminal xre family HTH domain [Flexilinea flocculi]
MATIKQIANLAGVSRGTVDRVLNNRGLVNPETEAKIREIAALLQYTPNKIGKTLSIIKKNIKFGFIIFSSTTSNPYFEDVVTGIDAKSKELEEFGVTVEKRFSDFDNIEPQLNSIDELIAQGINGLALTPVNNPRISEKLLSLHHMGIPVVAVNSDIDHSGRIAYVGSNHTQSGETAGGLMRLMKNGHGNIGVVLGSKDIRGHYERIQGFADILEKYAPDMRIIEVQENHDDDIESFYVTKEMLAHHPEIDGLYIASAGVYGACRAVMQLGLEKKLTIISSDSVPMTVKLIRDGVIDASICQQPFTQGSKPLQILFDYIISQKKPETDIFFTDIEIKIRENL